MEINKLLTNEEINAYVQREAGNHEYFSLTDEQFAAIGEKIKSSDLNLSRYEASKQIYLEISEVNQTKKFPRLAIAAAISLLLACTVFFYMNQGVEPGTNIALHNSNLPSAKELSARFGQNETLENRVNYPLRSSATSEIQPGNSLVFKEKVSFTWEAQEKTDYVLKIYDRNEKVLFKQSTEKGQVSWDVPADGVYYWSLEDNYEVFHWGKVFGLAH